MKKNKTLIDITQENLIECDNPKCTFVVPNVDKDPYNLGEEYLNKPCPKCGENLLTQKDYDDYKRMVSIIKWVNKWFGWLSFFKKDEEKVQVKIHNGVKITDRGDK